MVTGCSDTLIENSIRSAVIELCERASVYQAELDAVTTVANIYEYDLESPSGTSVHKIVWVAHQGIDLEPVTTTLLQQRLPNWREQNGTPAYYIQQGSASFWLAPVPSVSSVSSTTVRAVLKPTHSSSACDNDVMNDYRDTIVNGALFRLLRIPNKSWTDLSGAQVYGSLFSQGVDSAELRARGANSGVNRIVKYGGSNGAWKTRRSRYGSGG